MKPIAIFNTDTIAAELASIHGQYPDMFIRSLSALEPEREFVRFDVNRGEYPNSLDGFAGVLITGSQSAAYDTDGWISVLQQSIRSMVEAAVPLVGICFGHQIIHQALGGQVRKAQGGWCVGVHQNRLHVSVPGVGDKNATLRLLSSHQDQVVQAAHGAEVLASTRFCPVAISRIGTNILTLQGHPEFTREYALALMNKRRTNIGEQVYQKGVASLAEPLDDKRALRWMLQVLSS
ncbi:GMP synthase [Gilvimarinus sp. DA14]|uniref:glutamine amidotransferase-related protein n=1 Tax=Gilvimarinus sp. DA14 TaxID=2956798 RepID=UPI0020B68273|nr:GMP synthase [Gilvimarinus sp. DA14]UTF58582.1 GMP synthase [Gilvimarinus sp. DA14]